MKPAAFYLAIAMAIVIAGGWLATLSPDVDVWIYRQVAAHTLHPRPVLAEPGELSVLLCGTGSPLPDKSRAGPCALIAAGNDYYLVDAGLDSARNLMLWQVPLEKIRGVFITHMHSDHIAELGEIRLQTWVAGRKAPLKVYGPPGIEMVAAGFNEAYSLDAGYRIAHHGAAFLPPDAVSLVPMPVPLGDAPTRVAMMANGLKVTAIRVNHGPVKPAYGYRFDYNGRSIVISGDTAPDESLARAARGADVLLHEALSPELVGMLGQVLQAAGRARPAKIMHDIPGYHSSPVAAARIANEAHARLLVYTHLIPMLPNALAERAFLRGVSDVRPDGVTLGHDGLLIRLPPHSAAIGQSTLE